MFVVAENSLKKMMSGFGLHIWMTFYKYNQANCCHCSPGLFADLWEDQDCLSADCSGTPFFGTNSDVTYPTPHGLWPEQAIVKAIETASQQMQLSLENHHLWSSRWLLKGWQPVRRKRWSSVIGLKPILSVVRLRIAWQVWYCQVSQILLKPINGPKARYYLPWSGIHSFLMLNNLVTDLNFEEISAWWLNQWTCLPCEATLAVAFINKPPWISIK